jgi:hypothetical protein
MLQATVRNMAEGVASGKQFSPLHAHVFQSSTLSSTYIYICRLAFSVN